MLDLALWMDKLTKLTLELLRDGKGLRDWTLDIGQWTMDIGHWSLEGIPKEKFSGGVVVACLIIVSLQVLSFIILSY